MPLSPAETTDAATAAGSSPDRPASANGTGALPDRATGRLLLLLGLVGLAASFVLAVEKYALLLDPAYVPTCTLNRVLSCGLVMASSQVELVGFPDPLLGVAGFPAVVGTGAVLLAGAPLPRW